MLFYYRFFTIQDTNFPHIKLDFQVWQQIHGLFILTFVLESLHWIKVHNFDLTYNQVTHKVISWTLAIIMIIQCNIDTSDVNLVIGQGQFFAARIGLGQPYMVCVWIWKISPKNVNFFPSDQKKFLGVGFKSTRVKGGLASYLLRVKSKLGSGQGPPLECMSICLMMLRLIPNLTLLNLI